jgi:hypothetical protein
MSDFLAAAEEYARDLTAVARRHDLIAVVLMDPSEQRIPDLGLIALRDAEVDEIRWVDSGSEAWRTQFAEQARRFQAVRTQTLKRAGIDQILMPVDADYTRVLAQFFQQRIRR